MSHPSSLSYDKKRNTGLISINEKVIKEFPISVMS